MKTLWGWSKWNKKKQKPKIEIGSKWKITMHEKLGDPFPPIFVPDVTVTVYDIKDGWVRCGDPNSWFFKDERKPIKEFLKDHIEYKEEV
jgi:hypothetical protein